jgi:hypothetical protein
MHPSPPWVLQHQTIEEAIAAGSSGLVFNPGSAAPLPEASRPRTLGQCLRDVLQGRTEALTMVVAYFSLPELNRDVAGSTFDKPWLDRSWSYVPNARWRGEMCVRFLQANEDRFWEEIRLYLDHLRDTSDPAGCSLLHPSGDLTLKQVTTLCKAAGPKLSDPDHEALWYEGERQGRWTRREG